MMKLKAMVVSGLAALAATFALAAETIDPRGPVEYPGMKAAADEQGVQAQGYTFRNECRKPSPWQAKWIWLGGDQNAAVGTFRKEITLADGPAAGQGLAHRRHEVPALHQWPAGLPRAGRHGPRLRRRRDAAMVLRLSRPDAVFHRGQERHRRRGLPALAGRRFGLARAPGFPFRGRGGPAGTSRTDRQVRRLVAGNPRGTVPQPQYLRRRQGTGRMALAGL